MKAIRVSSVNTIDIQNTVIFNLIKILSKKEIKIVDPNNCDLLFVGPYHYFSVKEKLFRGLNKNKFFSQPLNLVKFLLKRKIQPIKIFYSSENFRHNIINSDFSITCDLGVCDQNHLRMPPWKEHIDWSHEGISRNNNVQNAKRFGLFHKIESLQNPLSDEFLKRKRKICLITTHLNEPRGSIYKYFSKQFTVDGYGRYFDSKIKNHNESSFIKKDLMKNYAFSLCPENSLYPGYYTEKITDAFSAKCLPITWADSNVSLDFNINAFVNLIEHVKDNYYSICNLLKDDSYLKKYAKEPLLLKKVDLENEKKFVQIILSLL
jgi:hypothetical protein